MSWLAKLVHRLRLPKSSLLISLLVTGLGLGLYAYTYFAPTDTALARLVRSFELWSYDFRFQVRGLAQPSPEIVIVAIDQKTLDTVGAWPFSRFHYARMLEHVTADGAAVVGFDINFPKPDEKSGLEAIRRAQEAYLQRTPPAQRAREYLAELEAMKQQADADARFADALRRAGNVILGQYFFFNPEEVRHVVPETQQEYENVLAFGAYSQVRPLADAEGNLPPPLAGIYTGLEAYLPQPNLLQFADAANYNFGYFNFVPEADAVFRRTNLVVKYKDDFYPSLDVQLLRHYLKLPDQEFGLFYNKGGVEYVQFGTLRVPTDPAGRILINFQGPAQTYRNVSFSDVAAGQFPPGTFTGKIVLVGATATGVGDLAAIPLQEAGFPGVEIHANVLDTMLTQRFLHRGLREELIDLGLILLLGLGVGWLLAKVPPSWTAPLTLAVLAVFLLATYLALARFHIWMNQVVPTAVLGANFAFVTAFRFFVEEKEKRKVRDAFKQYVPPGLIQELARNPERLKLGGEQRELTIMFSDIRGFTSLSERLTPLQLTRFLNDYMEEMTDIIFRHSGTLDKYEGDAIMAFWGAPWEQEDHALRACAAALDMGRRMDELRRQWRAEGKPDIDIGVGINTGSVVVGNMGSRKRFNYTVLGDPVNLASRLEGVTKLYASRMVVSEFTYQHAADALGILERRLCREFGVAPQELRRSNGSKAARRLRQVALYLAHTQQLAAPATLAQRFGAPGENGVQQAVAQVEQWQTRDKKLRLLLADLRHTLHPFVFRELDRIRVKGKQKPVAIYQLLAFGRGDEDHRGPVELFRRGLQAYRDQQWRQAIALFEAILQKYPDDGPARLFATRCREYQAAPPESGWDGVYEMKTK